MTPPTRPAPGRLELVQELLNTARIRKKREEVESPEEVERLLRRGLLVGDATLTAADHRRMIAVREALRSLTAANNGARFEAVVVARLDRARRDVRWELRLDVDRTPAFEPVDGGVDRALGKLLAAFQEAWVREQWQRLKACADASCRAVFYDKTGRASFCSAGCASRVRSIALRRGAKHGGRS